MKGIMKFRRTMLALALGATSAIAQAASLSWVTTAEDVARTESFNVTNFTTLGVGTTLDLGHLDMVGPGTGTVSYSYLGQESGYVNRFIDELGGGVLNESDTIHTSVSSLLSTAGALDFNFEGYTNSFAHNGGTWDEGTSIGLIGTDMTIAGVFYSFVIGYNDSAGAARLGDWDDFLVGVNFAETPPTEVPIPGTLGLLGLGLVGLGAARRKAFA
jgi:hypothetical protein